MLWVGLTGGIATGKSTVSQILRLRGIPVVDADDLARQAVRPGETAFEKIRQHFGQDVIGSDGEVDRRILGEKVFGHPHELAYLESLIHPSVREKANEARLRFASERRDFAVYDVPLLFEKSLQSGFDRVVVVACRPETQLQRLRDRNQLTEEQAQRRIQSQLPLDEKVKQASDVLWNEGTKAELELQVDQLIQKLRKPSSKA